MTAPPDRTLRIAWPPPPTDTVTLLPSEVRIARWIGQQRWESNRQAGVTNAKVGDQGDAFTDQNGFGGELAFCKLFNTYPDFSIAPRTALYDTGDTWLHGHPIDIKTTEYATGRLLAVPWKTPPTADCLLLFALMTGTLPTFTFRGFFAARDLLVPSRLGSLGHGPTYIAEQSELWGACRG